MHKWKSIAGGLAAVAVTLTATPASAVDDQASANDIAKVIAEAAPAGESVASAVKVSHTQANFANGVADIVVPLDAEQRLSVTGNGLDLSISLPEALNVRDGVVASDGTVVFEQDGDGAHAAVQVLDDGSLRLQTVLDSPEAPSTYTYDYGDGIELSLSDDGSVEIVDATTDGVWTVVGHIDAPWATDADGADVPTHYTVDGSTLTQHVEHGSLFTYPVTADPRHTYTWWNRTTYFNRYETKRIADRAIVGVIGNYIPWLPARVVAGYLTAWAGLFAYYHSNGQCGKVVSFGASGTPAPLQYGGSEAGGYCR